MLLAVASGTNAKQAPTYLFAVTDVTLADGVSQTVASAVRQRLDAGIAASPRLVAKLEGAPDPQAEPKQFARYLARNNMAAYRVNVEVLAHELAIEPMPAPRKGNYVKASVSLRAFGETIPKRVMAFTGEGSATIKIEVGSRVRERDKAVATDEALELAVEQALAESIRKLEAPKEKSGKKP